MRILCTLSDLIDFQTSSLHRKQKMFEIGLNQPVNHTKGKYQTLRKQDEEFACTNQSERSRLCACVQ